MSLAQKIDIVPTSKPEVLSLPEAAQLKVTPIDFRQLVRRLPERSSPATPATLAADASAAARSVLPQHAVHTPIGIASTVNAVKAEVAQPGSSAVALDLLTEVSSALSTLMDRCQYLESMLEATQDRAKSDLEAANSEALKYVHRSEMLTQMVGQLEETVTALQQRVAVAEDNVATVSAVAEKKQHEAAAAECLSALFQQRVLNSFGEGSVGHSILESVRIRSRQMTGA